MKKKLIKIFNNKIFVFVLGGFVFGVVSVCAITYFPSNQVTYDNSSSKLKSTNVQGAIDELYTTCSQMASSKKYMYYTTGANGYGTLYRCNVDGSNCSKIKSGDSTFVITNLYATSDYLYYTTDANEYGTLYRCKTDGSNCTVIISGPKGFIITNVG